MYKSVPPLKITQHAAVQYGSGVLSWHSGSLLWTRFPEILQSCLMWMLCPYSKILHFHPLTVHTRSTTLRHHGSQGLLCSPTSPIPYSILRLMILLVWWWLCRICKWHWGSCKTCNFTWMLLGTVAWSLSSLSMLPSICFAKAAWCCLHAKYNMGHIIWLFDNKSEQFCMLPSMIQNISFNTFPSDGGWRRQNSFQNFIAGGCGGVSATLVGHPFDTIKVMTQ